MQAVGAGRAVCFVRESSNGSSEVFFLGSEADFQNRPEAFAECWLQTNARFQLQPLDTSISPEENDERGHVHTGFQASYLLLADELLERLQGFSRRVCILGYSLGGALGTLAALHLSCNGFTDIDLVTFGSPRVGNEQFRSFFRDMWQRNRMRVARYVNTLDIVPHVPFNPEDALDSNRPGRLWRRLEEILASQQQFIAGTEHGNYVHVTPATVLDGLSTSVAGVVSRLASLAESEILPMVAALPVEYIAEHALSNYLRTLEEAPRPAWLCLSNRLLDSNSPVRMALRQIPWPNGSSRSLNSASAMSAGAMAEATATGVGIAGLLLPQLLTSAVSAVGCYCVAQRVSHVSEQLREHTEETSRSTEELQLELQQLRLELSNAQGSVMDALQSVSRSLQRRSSHDLLRRSRVAQRQLWEDAEVFLANPSESHAQMVREGCRELRKAAAEVLEMIEEIHSDSSPEELAQFFQAGYLFT